MNFEEFNKKYAEQALAQGACTKEQIDECMEFADESKNITLERLLVSEGVISPVTAIMITSKVLDIPFVDLRVMNIDILAANKTDKETCLKYHCLPIGKLWGSDVIVTDCLLDDKAYELKKIFGENIEFNLALRDEIRKRIDELYF